MYVTITHTTPAAPSVAHDKTKRTVTRTAHKAADLADVLRMAVDLTHARALKVGVRVRGYARDEQLAPDRKRSALQKMHDLLAHAIRNAQRSSLIVAEVGLIGSEIELRLRYARSGPAPHADCSSLNWIDEIWSWTPADATCAN
jgi:hypothetical protein